MILSSIFAVTSGLLILWIVLSFVTIQIQEWVNSRLNKRARIIEDAIHEMLANPNLKAQFYDHPVIHGLTAKTRRSPSSSWLYRGPAARGFNREKRHLPSHISAEEFALALFDMVRIASTESSLIQMGILRLRDELGSYGKGLAHPGVFVELDLLAELARSAAATEAGTAISEKNLALLKKETVEFIEKLRESYPQFRLGPEAEVQLEIGLDDALKEAKRLKGEIDEVLEKQPRIKADYSALTKLRRGIAALSVISPELSQTLTALVFGIEDEVPLENQALSLAREKIEKWFNDTMDRVSGVFQHYSQMLAFIIGVYLAVLLNLDMISLATYLWREPFVRQILIENASRFEIPQAEFLTDPTQAMHDFRKQFIGLGPPPVGWTINDSQGIPAINDGQCQLFPGEGQAFGIPIFYSEKCIAPPNSTDETSILSKLFGILITAFAAQLGAPLWFDIMNKLLRRR